MKVTLKNISGSEKYIQNKLNYIKVAVGETIEREIGDINNVPEGWELVTKPDVNTPEAPITNTNVNKKGRKVVTENLATPVADNSGVTSSSALHI